MESADETEMAWQKLDLIFPYICFFYGALMTVALNLPQLDRVAEKNADRFSPALIAQWRSHRVFALVCLVIGFLWILQNLWLS